MKLVGACSSKKWEEVKLKIENREGVNKLTSLFFVFALTSKDKLYPLCVKQIVNYKELKWNGEFI